MITVLIGQEIRFEGARDVRWPPPRYSTDAFWCRKLGRAFTEAKLSQQIYRSFDETTHALAEYAAPRQLGTASCSRTVRGAATTRAARSRPA